MDRTKYMIIDCKRCPPKRDCTVLLCKDRATEKFCFVNTNSKPVCSCRFDTIKDAIKDLENRPEVISYRVVGSEKYPLKRRRWSMIRVEGITAKVYKETH